MDHTVLAAAHSVSGSTLLRLQGALQGCCPKQALHFVHFPGPSCSGLGSWDLVGRAFCALPGQSSSGDQVLGECTVPGRLCILITSPVLATWSHRCAVRALSQVCRASPLWSWSQAVALLADVNWPGSQEDVVSNREPAEFGGGCWSLGSRLQQLLAFWFWLLPACLSAFSRGGGGVAQLALLWCSLNPLFCEQIRLWVRAVRGVSCSSYPQEFVSRQGSGQDNGRKRDNLTWDWATH